MNQRLYRSRGDRIIAGVAGGVAEYLRMDPSIVRILWAILMVFSGGLLFLLYIVMWIVVPEEPYDWSASRTGGVPGGAPPPPPPPPPVIPGWTAPGQPVATPPVAVTGEGTTPEIPTPTEVGAGTAEAPVPEAGAAETPAPEGAATQAAAGEAAQAAGGWAPPAATGPWPTDRREARRAERAVRRAERRASRDTSGAIIFGLILVLVGAFFLIQTYVPSIDAGRFWPIVLVVVGVVLLIGSIRPGSGEPGA